MAWTELPGYADRGVTARPWEASPCPQGHIVTSASVGGARVSRKPPPTTAEALPGAQGGQTHSHSSQWWSKKTCRSLSAPSGPGLKRPR